MSGLDQLSANVTEIRKRIAAAAGKSGRDASAIELVAVSKTVTPEQIADAVRAGVVLFGENYLQEAARKFASLQAVGIDPAEVKVDLIGHLQRNKAKDAVGFFRCIQSIDSFELAEKVAAIARSRRITQSVLLQVNVAEQVTKSGVSVAAAKEICVRIADLEGIKLEGLMTIGAYVAPDGLDADRRRDFVLLRKLRDSIQGDTGLSLNQLSMGMSHDFELAIEEGATIVRIGSAIFGERPKREKSE